MLDATERVWGGYVPPQLLASCKPIRSQKSVKSRRIFHFTRDIIRSLAAECVSEFHLEPYFGVVGRRACQQR
jgi:hypothetical protein